MLSNTATPKYYGQFRDAVIRGEIPVCETISMEMNRIDALIADDRFYYDPNPVEGWVSFCENELTLTNGDPLELLDTFKLWGEQVYGWYYFVEKEIFVPYKHSGKGRYVKQVVKRRLTHKQYLIVARGAAKTMYASTHQGYGLVIDTTTTHQIATSFTMKQAEEVLHPLKTAIVRARGPLFKFLTDGNKLNTKNFANKKKLDSTKKGIENFLTGSLLEIRPMRIEKLQSMQTKYATIDEWLSGDIREDVMGALEQGASKVDDWFILATSSEGTIRNSIGDGIKMELMSILKGEYYAPHVSIFWYKLDDVKEVADPEMWIKANPNLGKTVSYETYQAEVERAEKVPSVRNDILAKRFGIPTEGYTYFFPYEETIPHRFRKYNGMPCALGIDLSQGDDFCAFTFLFPLTTGAFGIKTRSYITRRNFDRLHITNKAMYEKYKEFLAEGTLIIMDTSILDMMQVYDDLDEFIAKERYEVICVGYDPYNAFDFIKRWTLENGEFGVEKIPQGFKTESVPLGEIKALSEDRLLLFDEALMMFAMGNCIVLEDTNGNRKLYKRRREQKIDNVAALMDAYITYRRNQDLF